MKRRVIDRIAIGVVLVGGLGACATASQPPPVGDRVITQSELASISSPTVYGAIGQLRPAWLGSAMPPDLTLTASGGPSVYMNRLYLGDSATLSTVRVQDVVEVRLVPPGVARARYGADNPDGAIELVTRDVAAY